ncbi:hypothetical protein BY996DRAFT_6445470 [Phakopsora pachyrhizi]|nr:hypothetical protein BY996DRAFT_6445470 [Phakopsora pachyrhizi]
MLAISEGESRGRARATEAARRPPISLASPDDCKQRYSIPSTSKENGFNLMINELNKKTKLTIHNMESLKKRAHPQALALQKKIKATKKLNLMCPCYEQMDHIFGSLPNVNPLGGKTLPQTTNESTDKDMLPNLGEAAPTPVNDEQLFIFPKEDEDIREGEDINQPALNSDIITNDIIKTSKSALQPTTYAELYEAKTDRESDYESGRISWEREKWSKESDLRMKQEEVKKELEFKKLEYAKEEKDKDLLYAREEKEKDFELKLLLAEKEKEALKRKEGCDLLLAVVVSSCSLAEISKIAKILNVD